MYGPIRRNHLSRRALNKFLSLFQKLGRRGVLHLACSACSTYLLPTCFLMRIQVSNSGILFNTVGNLWKEMFEQQFLPLFGEISIPDEFVDITCQVTTEERVRIISQQDKEIDRVLERIIRIFSLADEIAVRKLEFYAYIEYATVLCLDANCLYPFLKNCLLFNAGK